AVFVPCAFISGITGQFFRQFAMTIAVSTLISAFNSLTLSPALAAMLLKPRDKGTAPPLPRLAFPLIGALLGYEFLTSWVEQLAHLLPGDFRFWILNHDWAVGAIAAVAGAGAGWFLARPLNWLLFWLFHGFNRG